MRPHGEKPDGRCFKAVLALSVKKYSYVMAKKRFATKTTNLVMLKSLNIQPFSKSSQNNHHKSICKYGR